MLFRSITGSSFDSLRVELLFITLSIARSDLYNEGTHTTYRMDRKVRMHQRMRRTSYSSLLIGKSQNSTIQGENNNHRTADDGI